MARDSLDVRVGDLERPKRFEEAEHVVGVRSARAGPPTNVRRDFVLGQWTEEVLVRFGGAVRNPGDPFTEGIRPRRVGRDVG